MPRCPRCGEIIEEADKYCPYCGVRLEAYRFEKAKELKEKSMERKIYLFVIVIFAIVILATIVGYTIRMHQTSGMAGSESSRACRYVTVVRYSTTTVWTTTTSLNQYDLVNDKVVVPPRHYIPYQFTFDVETTLEGYFIASGGSGNDIVVTLFTDIGYTNFVNGHAGAYYYSSGKVTTDRFTVTVPPGTYYLVLDNGFSLVSNKVVTIHLVAKQLRVSYYQVPVVNSFQDVEYVCD
ncbi:MAG: zinc-ribbon domain-containing protein [Thaumarchaeota archaeon]|jgi:uncharacterized C2H2 Zn-finger protein|nr:zinc-ribbon domain-containing protein [Candidatus Geocrenenecus arthurdayi]